MQFGEQEIDVFVDERLLLSQGFFRECVSEKTTVAAVIRIAYNLNHIL